VQEHVFGPDHCALACVPVLSGTNMNEDSSPANKTIESIPVAVCGVEIPSHHRSSADTYAEGANTLIPECLGGTSGGMLTDLLSTLRQTGISTGMTNGIVTGILSGSSTGIVALEPFCGGSGSGLPALRPPAQYRNRDHRFCWDWDLSLSPVCFAAV
jgi:hypothetical protein